MNKIIALSAGGGAHTLAINAEEEKADEAQYEYGNDFVTVCVVPTNLKDYLDTVRAKLDNMAKSLTEPSKKQRKSLPSRQLADQPVRVSPRYKACWFYFSSTGNGINIQ